MERVRIAARLAGGIVGQSGANSRANFRGSQLVGRHTALVIELDGVNRHNRVLVDELHSPPIIDRGRRVHGAEAARNRHGAEGGA